MENLKTELKKVSTFEGHDGIGLNADIWINGVKCMHVHDPANGGGFEYYDYVHNAKDPVKVKALIAEFEAHIKSLPAKPCEYNGNFLLDDNGDKKLFNVDMDEIINDLFMDVEKKKEEAKMKRLMQKAILVGVPNASTYTYFTFKRALSTMPTYALQFNVTQIVKRHCTGDKVILNTNLKELGVTF